MKKKLIGKKFIYNFEKKYLFVLIAFLFVVSFYFFRTSYSSGDVAVSENYDKLQVEILQINERLTGTAPFNNAAQSNDQGVDISANDNYVRTNDVMNYTLEVRIGENDGYANKKGGIIKIRAKLPNQGNPTLMIFEQEAWMNNVSFNNDKTEIYAEYYIGKNQEPIGNQTITFSIRVLGYKKNITDNMKPTFEVWMDGNKPDNSLSNIESKIIRDEEPIIISGHQSIDASANSAYTNINVDKDNINGELYSVISALAIKQNVSEFPDFRGIEFPYGPVELEYKVKYKYIDVNTNEGYKVIDENTEGANGLLHGMQLIGTLHNYNLKTGTENVFYPRNAAVYHAGMLPGGNKEEASYATTCTTCSVEDSGTYSTSLNSNIFKMTISNYVINGTFPDKGMFGNEINNKVGYFAVLSSEFFTPFYWPNPQHAYNYTIEYTLNKIKFSDIQDNNYLIEYSELSQSLQDADTTNNSISIGYSAEPEGGFEHYMYREIERYNDNGYDYVYDGREITVFNQHSILNNFAGGTDNLIAWNPNKFSLQLEENGKYFYPYVIKNEAGFDAFSADTIQNRFGVYKTNHSGPTTESQVTKADYSDFDWYNTYEEASSHGKVSSLYIYMPKNNQTANYVYLRYKFKASVIESDYGKTTHIVSKGRALLYENSLATGQGIIYARNDYATFNDDSFFTMSEYDTNGNIVTYETPVNNGETFMMIGYKTSVITSVSDLDSNNRPKSIYDIQERYINFKITPSITNGKEMLDNDYVIDEVLVKTTLPKDLSYVSSSVNKTPASVVRNSDGTTTITWKYNNYQVNHAAPGKSNITFKAKMSLLIENNQELSISSVISAPADLSDEKIFRTGTYGVIIYNLAGSKIIKSIDKNIVNTNESFIVSSEIGNTSSQDLTNVKTIEVLPKNNDGNSEFSGTYIIKPTSLATNQRFFYTTASISSLNLTQDETGIYVARDIDFVNDNNWIEVQINDIIPSNATAIGTIIPVIKKANMQTYAYEVIPSNNLGGDKYSFVESFSSETLETTVKSNRVVCEVIDYKISGMVFKDQQNNNVYDTNEDIKLNNVEVQLYNENNQLIKTTYTDSNGNYEFSRINNQRYYVKFVNSNERYVVVEKNAGTPSVSSVANNNMQTDIFELNNQNVDNINLGLKEMFKVITRVEGEGGTIRGDEDVFQGNDSTVDNIVIEPNTDYYIEKITINGTEIDVDNPDGMTLPNFINMQEDKEVVVWFKSKVVQTPKTGLNTILPIISVIMLIIGMFMIIIYRNNNNHPKKKVLNFTE